MARFPGSSAVERRTDIKRFFRNAFVNALVVGSIPAQGAKCSKCACSSAVRAMTPLMVKGLNAGIKSKAVGSNPTRRTTYPHRLVA